MMLFYICLVNRQTTIDIIGTHSTVTSFDAEYISSPVAKNWKSSIQKVEIFYLEVGAIVDR